MSHQQIPLHMHGLQDTPGLYCSEKKKYKPQTSMHCVAQPQPHQGAAEADAGSARGRLEVSGLGGILASPTTGTALWEPLWKLLMKLPEDRLANCPCDGW